MNIFLRLAVAFSLALTSSITIAAPAQPFVVGEAQVEPGSRQDIKLEVLASDNEPGTFIPITILHGAEDGPVLATVSGVHGYEFAPIIAADRLADEVDPGALSGTLIIVRVANVPAFEERSPYVNPVDRKNLNRSFPGSAQGTLTERSADVLSREVVARADFLMDIHSGDGAEFLEAFVGVYGGPLSTDFYTALNVARGFGFPNLVRYSMNTQIQVDTRRSLNRQGVASGIPTILVEIGQNGSRDDRHVDAIIAGVKNALGILEMWEQPPTKVPPALRLFESSTSVKASHSGVLYPANLEQRYFFKGDLVGTIRDYSGLEVERLYSPIDGYALYGLRGPPVRVGDSVVTLGNPIGGF
ncbi:MAG: M14 family metallopeptidase [Pseudomonadota bacterium]